MARKKRDLDAAPVADAAAELIVTATDESQESTDAVATEAAIDALDTVRESSDDVEAAEQPKPKRGRPAGSRNRAAVRADAAELPKTKKEWQAHAERLQTERDDARAKAEARQGEQDAQAIERLAMSLAAGGQMIGTFMSKRRGPHWKLAKEESDAMGQAWATCLAPYADSIGTALPWAVAIGVTYTVFAQRIEIDNAAEAELAEPTKLKSVGTQTEIAV